MNKLVFITALTLCLGFTNAEGESNPMEDMMKMLQGMNPATMCPQLMGMSCKTQSEMCIDIPQVIDCSTLPDACAASSKALCDCISACAPGCAGKVDCSGKEGAEEVECKAKAQMCVSQCEMKCPIDQMTKAAQQSMQQISKMTKGLVAQLQGMLGGGAAAH